MVRMKAVNYHFIGAVIVVMFLTYLLFCAGVRNGDLQIKVAQLQSAAAELKVQFTLSQMNAKEIEAERHEMEMAWKGSQDNLKLAKKIIHDYGMSKEKELHEEIVRSRAVTEPKRTTGAVLKED